MTTEIKWHYIQEEGLPKVKDNKARAFLICYRAEFGYVCYINDEKHVVPNGQFIDTTTVALFQNKESKDGFAYTPAKKFYWGGEIFNTAYAWAEFPQAIEYK